MKKIKLSILICLVYQFSVSQCDIKTTNGAENEMKYFTPKPIIRELDYEIGVSIYKNITSNIIMINSSILFKGKMPEELTGNLIIKTINDKEISLKPLMSDLLEMNEQDVAIGLYEIDDRTLIELSNFPLKSVFMSVGNNLVGSNVSENLSLLIEQIKCLKKAELLYIH